VTDARSDQPAILCLVRRRVEGCELLHEILAVLDHTSLLLLCRRAPLVAAVDLQYIPELPFVVFAAWYYNQIK
jgi:hypothetical protein